MSTRPIHDGPAVTAEHGGAGRSPWLGTCASCGTAAVLLIVIVSALRLAYVLWLCPYTLAEDEAHYWEWSRRPDLSYYSKGPGIAWIIAVSGRVFAGMGFPPGEAAVRAPAVLFAAIAAGAVAGLARDITRDNRVAFIAALLVLMTPVFQLASIIMTIDMPYVAFWAIGAWMGWRALEGRSRWAWLGLGAAIAGGFLVKYTILLLPPGLIAYAILRRGHARTARGWGWWASGGALVALLGLLPVTIWNARSGWPTVHHLLGHLGVAGGDMPVVQGGSGGGWRYNPLWTLEYIGLQLAVMLPASVLMIAGAVLAWKRRATQPLERPGRAYLLSLAIPVLLFYLGVSFVTDVEPNWPIAGYVTLFVLAAWFVVDSHDEARRGPQPTSGPLLMWTFAWMVGLAAALLMLRLDWMAQSRLARFAEGSLRSAGVLQEGQRLIPLGRFTGADAVAASAAQVADDLARETGLEPFFIASVYGRASQLAYYLPGHPVVYCSGPYTGGRPTQYDFWDDTSLRDPALRGRPAVLVGGERHQWEPAFDEVREIGRLAGETKKGRLSYIGIGYRGFPSMSAEPAGTNP